MTEHDDLLYLTHIDEAVTRILLSAGTRGRVSLEQDAELYDATLFRLQTLAESTQRLSSEVKDRHPEIPWRQIAGLRNRIVHGYLTVDTEVIWGIVERDLPKLATCVRSEIEARSR